VAMSFWHNLSFCEMECTPDDSFLKSLRKE
jgi:hypothetical protein